MRHSRTCKAKQEYREKLELQTNTATNNVTNTVTNTVTNNVTNTVNFDIMIIFEYPVELAEKLTRKFGAETTERILDDYLRRMTASIEVPLTKVVSKVAKKLFPQHKKLQITNK
tara:strand:- start:613 stop:954 length:342 start_codon:yes stop_codon:yes gene_type:complete